MSGIILHFCVPGLVIFLCVVFTKTQNFAKCHTRIWAHDTGLFSFLCAEHLYCAVLNIWRRLPTFTFHCLRLFYSPILRSLSFMAVYIPSSQVLLGWPRFFLPSGFQWIIIFGSRVGSILSTWPLLSKLYIFLCLQLNFLDLVQHKPF